MTIKKLYKCIQKENNDFCSISYCIVAKVLIDNVKRLGNVCSYCQLKLRLHANREFCINAYSKEKTLKALIKRFPNLILEEK